MRLLLQALEAKNNGHGIYMLEKLYALYLILVPSSSMYTFTKYLVCR